MSILKDRLKKRNNSSLPSKILDMLPLAAIVALAGFSVVAMTLLLIGQFHTELIWTIGPAVALLSAWVVFRFAHTERPGGKRERMICDLVVLVGVVLWGAWNFTLTSQHLMTDRDPATYAVAGAWLSEHSSFSEQSTTTFKEVGGFDPESAGFWVNEETDTLYPQGQHLLPALLGAVGKIVGPTLMLHFNVLFGMTALLAVYCFARLFLLPRWAVLATAVMSVSLPLLYFSRDTYTEPLTLTFIFGGLALLMIAQKTHSLWAWGLAGWVFGASILARVDAYLAVVGIMAFLAIYMNLADGKKDQLRRFKEIVVFIPPIVALGALAWFDLKLYSPPYYQSLKSMLLLQIAAAVLVLIVGVVAYGIFVVKPKWKKLLDRLTARWRAGVAAVLVLVMGVFFVAQPLWFEGEAERPNGFVYQVQEENGDKKEDRSYAELAPQWVSWYIGPVLASLGVIGLAYGMYRSMRDKNILLLCALFVVLSAALVYFLRPSITPDQVWAARRMLPIVIPGVVIFGVYAFAELASRIKITQPIKGIALSIGAVALAAAPLLTSNPFLGGRFLTQFAPVNSVCERLPDNAVVVWLGLARMEMVQSTRAYCNLESYGYNFNDSDIPSAETLARIAQLAEEKGQVVFVGSYSHQYKDVLIPSHQKAMRELNYITYERIAPTLISAPYKVEEIGRGVMVAEVQPNGSLAPLPKVTK